MVGRMDGSALTFAQFARDALASCKFHRLSMIPIHYDFLLQQIEDKLEANICIAEAAKFRYHSAVEIGSSSLSVRL